MEKHVYTQHALNLICLDCGEVGADGFKHVHRCHDVGYRPMEVVNFLKECEDLSPVLHVGGMAGTPFPAAPLQAVVADVFLW